MKIYFVSISTNYRTKLATAACDSNHYDHMYGWPVDQVLEKKCEREVSFKQIDNSDIMRH